MVSKREGLKIGSKAPDFDLPTDQGASISLGALRGKNAVVYFYPKDDTAGCTREAMEFSDALKQFTKAGAVVIGISKDSIEKHAKFRAKHDLGVTLASDEDGKTVAAYDSWVEKTLYGRKYMGIDRSTFLIDRSGVIRQVWRKVRVPGHVEEVLAAAKSLGKD